MNEETKIYQVNVVQEDDWWIIHVSELDLTTQAPTREEVDEMAKGVISATLVIGTDEFDIEVTERPMA